MEQDATLGCEVSIGRFLSWHMRASAIGRCCIELCIGDGAVIGDDCIIHSHVAVRERVVIGTRHHRTGRSSAAMEPASSDGRTAHTQRPQTSSVIIETTSRGRQYDDRSPGDR